MVKLRRLRAVRQMKGLTQEQLAAAAGISRTALIAIEQGTEPKPATVEALAKALEVSPEELESEAGALLKALAPLVGAIQRLSRDYDVPSGIVAREMAAGAEERLKRKATKKEGAND